MRKHIAEVFNNYTFYVSNCIQPVVELSSTLEY